MVKAIWQDAVIAESDQTEVVDGNHYFPAASVDRQYLRESDATSVCGWKGTANYYDIVVADQVNPQAVWYYAEPKPQAANIKDHVAFWKGVKIVD